MIQRNCLSDFVAGLRCSSDIIKSFRLQKRAIGLVTKSSFSDPFRQHFRRMKFLLLPSLYIFRYLLLVHSNSDKFYGYNYFHFHFTRNSSILQYPIHRTFLEKGPWYSCTRMFNNLPNHTRKELSLNLL